MQLKKKIAIQEAKRLGITVIAPLDTNCDPDVVDYPIPGNDDAIRSIQLFCTEMAAAMNEGRAALAEENGEEAPVTEAEMAEVKEEAAAEAEATTEEATTEEA
jgi:small subunit ribosomal protein S2